MQKVSLKLEAYVKSVYIEAYWDLCAQVNCSSHAGSATRPPQLAWATACHLLIPLRGGLKRTSSPTKEQWERQSQTFKTGFKSTQTPSVSFPVPIWLGAVNQDSESVLPGGDRHPNAINNTKLKTQRLTFPHHRCGLFLDVNWRIQGRNPFRPPTSLHNIECGSPATAAAQDRASSLLLESIIYGMDWECNVFTQTHDNCTSASLQY